MIIAYIVQCDLCGYIIDATKEAYYINMEEDVCLKCMDEL